MYDLRISWRGTLYQYLEKHFKGLMRKDIYSRRLGMVLRVYCFEFNSNVNIIVSFYSSYQFTFSDFGLSIFSLGVILFHVTPKFPGNLNEEYVNLYTECRDEDPNKRPLCENVYRGWSNKWVKRELGKVFILVLVSIIVLWRIIKIKPKKYTALRIQ